MESMPIERFSQISQLQKVVVLGSVPPVEPPRFDKLQKLMEQYYQQREAVDSLTQRLQQLESFREQADQLSKGLFERLAKLSEVSLVGFEVSKKSQAKDGHSEEMHCQEMYCQEMYCQEMHNGVIWLLTSDLWDAQPFDPEGHNRFRIELYLTGFAATATERWSKYLRIYRLSSLSGKATGLTIVGCHQEGLVAKEFETTLMLDHLFFMRIEELLQLIFKQLRDSARATDSDFF